MCQHLFCLPELHPLLKVDQEYGQENPQKHPLPSLHWPQLDLHVQIRFITWYRAYLVQSSPYQKSCSNCNHARRSEFVVLTHGNYMSEQTSLIVQSATHEADLGSMIVRQIRDGRNAEQALSLLGTCSLRRIHKFEE